MNRVVLALLALGVAAGSACLRPCRSITTAAVPIACEEGTFFEGEIHFDDPATFASFLELECMPSIDEAARQELVDAVDFDSNAVFVSVGLREQLGRCIADRQAEETAVCEDGLRVAFADRLSDELPCPGKWTVAFALPRAELRAAIDDELF